MIACGSPAVAELPTNAAADFISGPRGGETNNGNNTRSSLLLSSLSTKMKDRGRRKVSSSANKKQNENNDGDEIMHDTESTATTSSSTTNDNYHDEQENPADSSSRSAGEGFDDEENQGPNDNSGSSDGQRGRQQKQQQQHQKQQQQQEHVQIDGEYTKATELDCLCLKSPTAEQRLHPGNFLFRKVVIEHSIQFREAEKSPFDSSQKKEQVADDVLTAYRRLNGRLLQPPGGSAKGRGGHGFTDPDALWQELDYETAKRKAKNALTGCIADEGFYAMRPNEFLSPDGKLIEIDDSHNNEEEANETKMGDENELEGESDGMKTTAGPPRGKETMTGRRSFDTPSSTSTAQPTEKDYLVVRGGTHAERNNPGSIKFRQIIEDHALEWVWAQDMDTYEESREKLINSIYDTFRATGGRVLTHSEDNKSDWVECSREDVLERIRKHSSSLKRAMTPKNGAIVSSGHICKPTQSNEEESPTEGRGRRTKYKHESTLSPSPSPGKRGRDRQKKYPIGAKSPPNTSIEADTCASVVEPTSNDFMCVGSGHKFPDHPGNQNYRRLIQDNAYDYQKATTGDEKTAVVVKVWEAFKKRGGRILLQKDAAHNLWKSCDDEDSMNRVRKALAGCTTISKVHRGDVTINLDGKRGTRHSGAARTRTDSIKIYKPNKEDYLCLPNGAAEQLNNPGNLEYRRLVESRAQAYVNAATNDRKLSIRSSILDKFHRTGGRILAPVPGKASAWYELDDDSALKALSEALIECHEKNYESQSSAEEDDEDDRNIQGSHDGDKDDEISLEEEETTVIDLSPKDCLCVMNVRKDQIGHPGNERFNEMVEKHSLLYWSSDTSIDHRREIREKIVDEFLKTGGRFVSPIGGASKNEPGCSWVEVDADYAIKKVGNALRRTQDSAKAKLREMAKKDKSDRTQKRKSSAFLQEQIERDPTGNDRQSPGLITERDLRPADYVSCVGGKWHSHNGNEAVKKLVESSAQLYYDCGDNESFKKGIREMILTAVHVYGGRFLVGKKNTTGTPPWEELDDQTALRKIHRKLQKFHGVDRSSSPTLREAKNETDDEDHESNNGDNSSRSGRCLGLFQSEDGKQPAKKQKIESISSRPPTNQRSPHRLAAAVACGDFQGSMWGATTGHDEYGIGHQEEYSDIEDLVF